MSKMRNGAAIALAGAIVCAAGPVLAQYQPYTPPGQQRGRFAHACFPAQQGGYLRVEWTASGRWALYNWPPQSNLRIYIGDEPAQWCWSPRLNELMRPCRPNPEITKPVAPGC